MNFVDDANNLYVKFNEIDLVIKRINAVRNGGKVDILVFDIKEGERTRQSLIQAKELIGFENHPFESLNDIAIISNAIRGRYRKIYLICLPQD